MGRQRYQDLEHISSADAKKQPKMWKNGYRKVMELFPRRNNLRGILK